MAEDEYFDDDIDFDIDNDEAEGEKVEDKEEKKEERKEGQNSGSTSPTGMGYSQSETSKKAVSIDEYNKFINTTCEYLIKSVDSELFDLYVGKFYAFSVGCSHSAFLTLSKYPILHGYLTQRKFDMTPVIKLAKLESKSMDIPDIAKANAYATYYALYSKKYVESGKGTLESADKCAEDSLKELLGYWESDSDIITGLIQVFELLLNDGATAQDSNESSGSNSQSQENKSSQGQENPISDEEAIQMLGVKSELGDSLVDKTIEKVVALAQKIYSRCATVKPIGVVYSNGMLKYDRGSRQIYKYSSEGKEEYFQNLYDAVNKCLPNTSSGDGGEPYKEFVGLYRSESGLNIEKLSELIFNDTLNAQYNYLPELALFISQGVLPLKDGSFHHFNNAVTFKRGLIALLSSVLSGVKVNEYRSAHGGRISGLEVNTLRLLRNTFITLELSSNQANFILFKQGNVNMQMVIDKIKTSGLVFFSSGSKIFYSSQSNLSGLELFDLVILMDEASYLQEVMFAYKAYEKLSSKPSLSSIVLGKRLNGKNMTFDFRSNTNQRVAILAGSRSGKGVLTLNILVSFLANDCPLIYLDGKPDMAVVLWDLEKELKSKGYNCNILAVDGVNPMHSSAPRTYSLESTVDSALGIPVSMYSVVPYLKAWQLSNLIVNARCNVKVVQSNPLFNKNKKMFTVVDEILNINEGLNNLLTALSGVKPKKNDVDLQKKVSRYMNFLSTAGLGIGQFISKDAGQGNAGYLILSQSCRMDSDVNTEVFRKILRGVQYSIKGRSLQKTNKTAIPDDMDGAEYINLGEKDDISISGYFALHSGLETPAKKDVTVFKSYLLLNKNDYVPSSNGVYDESISPFTAPLIARVCGTGSSMNRVLEDKLVNEELTYVNSAGQRVLREEIGFAGLARSVIRKLMGSGVDADQVLAETLSKGYNSAWYLMKLLGLDSKYENVEQYLFDISPESLYTFDELVNYLIKGEKLITAQQSSDDYAVEPLLGYDDSVTGFDNYNWGTDEQSSSANSSDTSTTDTNDANTTSTTDADGASTTSDSYQFNNTSNWASSGTGGSSTYSSPNGGQGYSASSGNSGSTQTGAYGYQDPYESYSSSQDIFREQFVVNQVDNPFDRAFMSNSVINSLVSMNRISSIVVDNITRLVGDLSRVQSFEVEESGKIVINGVLFQPELSNAYLSVLPFDIQSKVKRGYWIELFSFADLYRFPNLRLLSIANISTAEYKARNELRMGNKSWLSLKHKFKYLTTIVIGGSEIVDEASEQTYKHGSFRNFRLGSSIRKGAGFIGQMVDPDGNSRSSRIWQSKGVTKVKKVLGAGLGTAAVWGAVSLFGVWGIVASALAITSLYKSRK